MKKYRINEVAEKFGIAPSRIRHYENEQLIKCKRDPENNYMTDVIHHVPDIDEMFKEIYRVIEKNGKVCICTQSHRQIEKRYMSEFFPGTAVADKKRYPAIFDILQSGENAGFKYFKTEVIHEDLDVELGEAFLELLMNKGYSMLHQISEEEYQSGLKVFKENMKDGSFVRKSAGGSLVWLEKVE